MMDVWKSLYGMVEVQILSAQPFESINTLSENGISLYCTQAIDDLTVNAQLYRKDLPKANKLLHKKGDRLKLVKKHGIYWRLKKLLKRPVLLAGMACVLMLISFLPTRIFFFRVEGNQSIPTRYLLEVAANCGISFGASRREVRSEKVKNALLEAIPQLQWAGINTSGCVATISVREREQEAEIQNIKTGVSSIVASKEGIIDACTATRGNLLCKVGQAVLPGEILISGYTDCGLSIRATQAQGEVYAVTKEEISAVAMAQYTQKDKILRTERKYAVIIGKNRINFYKGSGNLDGTCDKMYEERFLTLPGGFQLPVSLVTETWTYYAPEKGVLDENEVTSQLSDFSREYLLSQMIAGQILSKTEQTDYNDSAPRHTATYTCREMIGRVQEEEIILPNGKHD